MAARRRGPYDESIVNPATRSSSSCWSRPARKSIKVWRLQIYQSVRF